MDEGFVRFFDLQNMDIPEKKADRFVGGTYTVEPYGAYYFLDNNIFNFLADNQINFVGYFPSITNCDKLVSHNEYAYNIKRESDYCYQTTSGLDIYSLEYINRPQYIASISLTNPIDIDISGDWLYLIDNSSQLVMYHIEASGDLTLYDSIGMINGEQLKAYDDKVFVRTTNAYNIYEASEIFGLSLLSTISF
jgi:hypothetical protein